MMLRRRTMIALLIVLLGASPVFSQDWVRLLFPVKEHDFGTVPRGAKVEYRFKITNPFEEEIRLTEVTSSCVCTTPILETPILKAHETGTVLAHFNTDKVNGNQKATLHVYLDKPSPAVAMLQVRGHVRGDVTFEPSSVQFGSVSLGEEREKTVKVIYHGTNAFWKITNTESSNPNIAVKIGKTTPKRGRIEVEIMFKLDKNAPTGPLNENVFLTSSDSTGGRIPLMIEGDVLAPIMVKPEVFSLGTVYEGDKIVRPIVLTGDKPFLVKGITVSGNMISINPLTSLKTEPKSTHILRLNFTVPKIEEYKSLREQAVFETDNPDISPTLTILAVVKPEDEKAFDHGRQNTENGLK